MSRQELDRGTLNSLSTNVPDIDKLFELIKPLAPDFISSRFPHDSAVPVASVCLQDVYDVLWEARYGLFEVFAHRVAYIEKKDEPNPYAATLFGRYYATDAALRLYSAAAHLHAAVVAMFGISSRELKPRKRIRYASPLSKLKHYLLEHQPDHIVTRAINELECDTTWQQTIDYRNSWVHEQPPILKGLGTAWKRRKRWEVDTEHGQQILGIGTGDAADYSLDDLIDFVQPALFKFAETVRIVIEYYRELLQDHGITLGKDTISITIGGS